MAGRRERRPRGSMVARPRSRPLRVLVLSGPNLHRLGRREPEIYGAETLAEIHARLALLGAELGVQVECRQSNHEGELVDWVSAAKDTGFAAIVLNGAAYTHTSIALYDAIKAADVPVVEVHLSNPMAREPFRERSYLSKVAVGTISGFGSDSYLLGLRAISGHLSRRSRSKKR